MATAPGSLFIRPSRGETEVKVSSRAGARLSRARLRQEFLGLNGAVVAH